MVDLEIVADFLEILPVRLRQGPVPGFQGGGEV
jgi:hypothetical protein